MFARDRATASLPVFGEGGAEGAGWGRRVYLARLRPTRLALGFASARSTLPENGEGRCGAIVREQQIQTSDSHFKQPTLKNKAPPPLFSQGAGRAGHFHPLGSRGENPLTT